MQFLSLYSKLPPLLKKLQKKNFNYQTTINQKEFEIGEKLFVTNTVSKGNYSFSGAHMIMQIVPRNKNNQYFSNDYKNEYKGQTKLQEIKINDKTKIKGVFYATNIDVGYNEGVFDLYTFFVNSTRGYTEHINISSFTVINKTKILVIYYCFWVLLILLAVILFIRGRKKNFFLFNLICPIFLLFKNQNYLFKKGKRIKPLSQDIFTLLLGYLLVCFALFFPEMIFILCCFFISLIIYLFVNKKRNLLYFLLIFLSCHFFITIFWQQYGQSYFVKKSFYFSFEIVMMIFFPVVKLLWFFQEHKGVSFSIFKVEQKLKIFVSLLPILFFTLKTIFLFWNKHGVKK